MILEAIQALIFPKICHHCSQKFSTKDPFFCTSCLEHFSLINVHSRCPKCFQEPCQKECSLWPYEKALACFETLGPGKEYVMLAETVATEEFLTLCTSLLILQFSQKKWEGIAFVIGLEEPFSERLARAFANALSLPYAKQKGLISCTDGAVLVIGKRLSDKEPWEKMAQKLFFSFPEKMYALALLE